MVTTLSLSYTDLRLIIINIIFYHISYHQLPNSTSEVQAQMWQQMVLLASKVRRT